MCGTATPKLSAHSAPLPLPDSSSDERVEWRPVGESNLPTLSYDLPEPAGRSLVPFLLLFVIVLAAFLFWMFHRGKARNAGLPDSGVSSAPVAESPAASAEAPPEPASDPPLATPAATAPAPPRAREGRSVPAAGSAVPNAPAEKTAESDPSELWKLVRQGNIEAEVALAKLYLEGTEVPKNCEQAHMLLLAASKRGNKNADELLSGSYAERCP
jgi:hypothetical protein